MLNSSFSDADFCSVHTKLQNIQCFGHLAMAHGLFHGFPTEACSSLLTVLTVLAVLQKPHQGKEALALSVTNRIKGTTIVIYDSSVTLTSHIQSLLLYSRKLRPQCVCNIGHRSFSKFNFVKKIAVKTFQGEKISKTSDSFFDLT